MALRLSSVDFPPLLGINGVRHLVWKENLRWRRLLGLLSCRFCGRIGKRLATQEQRESDRSRAPEEQELESPGALMSNCAILVHQQDSGKKVWGITAGSGGKSWIPGLLSEFGNKAQSSDSDEDPGQILFHLLLAWWPKARKIIWISQL